MASTVAERDKRIAELERSLDQMNGCVALLTKDNVANEADLHAANLTIKSMGARCDKLAGLLRRWFNAERQIGPLDMTIGRHNRLITETETLLRDQC